MDELIVIVVFAVVLAPLVLAILAFIQSRRTRRENLALVGRVDVLERRISWLRERLKDVLSAPAGAAPASPVGEATGAPGTPGAPQSSTPDAGTVLDLGTPEAPAVPSAHRAPQSAGPPKPRRPMNLEALIGGRVLNRIGILAMLIAAAFFLKWAFDNAWIGPSGRLALGFLGGTALLIYSQWLLRRDLRYFSEGITTLGAGVLYLTLYAGKHYYDLIPEFVAFAGMIAVTLAFAILAIGRNSQRLGFLAFLGGYLTPILLSTGRDAQVELFTYVAVLNGGLLIAALKRNWRTLEPQAFLWTVIYFAGWYSRFYVESRLGLTAFFAMLFFSQFLTAQIVRGRQLRRLEPEQIALVLANAGGLLLALGAMLYEDHRWALTLAVLALSALHLLVLRTLPEEGAEAGSRSVPRLLLAVLAMTFVTLAIPIRLEGQWIAIAWAVEGLLLVVAGFRSGESLLRGAGLAVFVLVPFRLLTQPIDAEQALLNPRFSSLVLIAVCFLGAYLLSRINRETLVEQEPTIFAVVGIAANLVFLAALSLEVWDFAGDLTAAVDDSRARQVGLSLLWAVYATALLVSGVRKHSAALRWQGLLLLGVTILKVFLLDLSFLERGYRILSFVVLGALLLAVSFVYQRFRVGADPEEDQ